MLECDSDSTAGGNRTDQSTSASSERPPSRPGSDACSASENDEELAFFDDIQNYIPLGCLVYDSFQPTPNETAFEPTAWKEHEQRNLNFAPQLGRLVTTRRLRVYGKRSDDEYHYILRLFFMPHDVGRRFDCKLNNKQQSILGNILSGLIVDSSCWNGSYRKADENTYARFDPYSTANNHSLFFLFNSLPSPKPDPNAIMDKESKLTMSEILSGNNLAGMRTDLYPYQQRTVALMLEQESTVQLKVDPRLEIRHGPTGEKFYFDPRELSILKQPRYFETIKGGILAETMGLGKTLIALSLVFTTKYRQPYIPPLAMRDQIPVRSHVGTLADMAVSAIIHHAIPWKARFCRHEDSTGEDLASCRRRLDALPVTYKVPFYRAVRNTRFGSAESYALRYENKTLSSATIIVVPLNLLSQWQTELAKHFDEGAFHILTLDKMGQRIPPAAELMQYDIVLFSRARFEKEISDGCTEGRRVIECGEPLLCSCTPIEVGVTRDVLCDCIREQEIYISPLRHLHWLRIIVDEGHSYASSISNAVLVADKLVTADRRWILSGTPLKDIVSVEVDAEILASSGSAVGSRAQALRKRALDQRQLFSLSEDKKAIQSFGILAAHFLKVQPWALSGHERCVEWGDYAFRHESLRRHTYSGLSLCLQKTLANLVVKTRPEDVERDITLPPLSHNIVRLQPSFYDKLTANSFNLVLTSNAVTSERADADYLFHKNSTKLRSQLILNLRQSNFFWTGFSEADIQSAIKHGENYLRKPNTQCKETDRHLLIEALEHGKKILHEGWKAQSRLHEPGFYLESWPTDSRNIWDLEGKTLSLAVVGEAQLLLAQLHVNSQLSRKDPFMGLAKVYFNTSLEGQPNQQHGKPSLPEEADVVTKMGVPLSIFNTESNATINDSSRFIRKGLPKVNKTKADMQGMKANSVTPTKAYKRKLATMLNYGIPEASQLRETKVVGTASSKLSYIIDQVMQFNEEEKMLIFYDFDNSAFYLAQALELLDVKHHIYAKSLSNELRSKYISDFLHDESIRVMLLDIRCAALGLNINVASRVIFINPVCRPNIEAQAIKRAHRIGQTRPVVVETILLEGTIEEAMFERARKMTREEHQDAAKALEDDKGIANIIQMARPLPIDPTEEHDRYKQMARLKTPQILFARPNRGSARWAPLPRRKDVAAS